MRTIATKRIYESASKSDGFRVLVDRIWPRGVSKQDAALACWARDLAPSNELRKWFDHDPAKWEEFQQRYRKELKTCRTELDELLEMAGAEPITLLFGAKDTEHNQALVLKSVLERMK